MFGKNVIHSPQSYTNPPGTLVVTSMFYTLQGEGPYAGMPAVFIRLKGCNLQCSFCDTYFDAGDEMTLTDIALKVEKLVVDFHKTVEINIIEKCPLIVITGGEPSLQFDNVNEFCKRMAPLGFIIQIESNGVLDRQWTPEVHVVCSPKVNEKTNKFIQPKPDMLERIDTLKFVVSSDPNSIYYDIPEFAIKWKRNHPMRQLYISPMNCYLNPPQKVGGNATLDMRSEVDERISFWTPNLLDPVQNQKNHEHAAYLCMKHGARLSLQTHLYASLP
jgi:organic radical activating enzyme